MTFTEKFDYIKKKYALKADTSKFKDEFIAAQITMSDEDCGGTFYAAFIDGKLNVEPYDYHDNTVAVIVNSLLLEECIKGKADPVKEYMGGNLQAWGNLDHALQLIEVLKGKKRVCKKKTEVKVEAVEIKAEEKTEAAPKKRTCKKTTDAPASKEEAVKEEIKTESAPKKRTCKKKTTEKE